MPSVCSSPCGSSAALQGVGVGFPGEEGVFGESWGPVPAAVLRGRLRWGGGGPRYHRGWSLGPSLGWQTHLKALQVRGGLRKPGPCSGERVSPILVVASLVLTCRSRQRAVLLPTSIIFDWEGTAVVHLWVTSFTCACSGRRTGGPQTSGEARPGSLGSHPGLHQQLGKGRARYPPGRRGLRGAGPLWVPPRGRGRD